jgi:hypothetical protein
VALVGTAHDVSTGVFRTCSTVVAAACRVPEILAIDLAVVVAVTNTAANNSSLGGRAGQVALAGNATVSVGGVGVATSQVLGADLAVVVAVKGVVCTGSSRVVSKTSLPQASIAVVVGGSVIVAVTGVLVAVGSGLVGETCSSADATSATDVLRDTLKLVVALLAAGESTALGLELLHGHGWESSSLMVGSLVMVNLMDGDGSVDNVGLDGLLLNNGLDSLVDVLNDVSVWWGIDVLLFNLRGGRALRQQ